MKISQMSTDKAADVLVRIVEPAANMMHDDKVIDMLKSFSGGKDQTVAEFFGKNLVPIVCSLLKDHRTDVFEIVAALSDKTVDEVAEQKVPVTIVDIRDSVDKELIDFFGSLR